MFNKDNKFGFINNNDNSNNNIEGLDNIKTDINNIKDDVNELNTQYKDIVMKNIIISDISEIKNINQCVIHIKNNINGNDKNYTIEGLNDIIIFGNNSNINLNKTTDSFIKFKNMDTLTIKNLKISSETSSRNSSCYGIILENVNNFLIENVQVEGSNGAGIFLSNCTNGSIRNCLVKNTLADGIHITNKCKNIEVCNNKVLECSGDDSIAVVSYVNDNDYCENIKIDNNTCINSQARGITNIGGKYIYITNNYINNTASSSILVNRDSTYNTLTPVNTVISNNQIYNSGKNTNPKGNLYGVEISESDSTIIENNIVKNSEKRGISTSSTAKNVICINNTFSSGGDLNQFIGAENYIISNNTFEGNNKEGLVIKNSKNSIVTDNIFKNNSCGETASTYNLYIVGCSNINATNNISVDDRDITKVKYGCMVLNSTMIDIRGFQSIGSPVRVDGTSENVRIDLIKKESSPSAAESFYADGTKWINTTSNTLFISINKIWKTLI